MFCAAIPAAAATGAVLNNKQLQRRLKAELAGEPEPASRPVTEITLGVTILLLAGSVTYHTLWFGI